MPIKRIVAPTVTEPAAGLWSNCLLVDGVAYIAGLTARGTSFDAVEGDDAYAQAKVIFGKMRALVEAAGGSMADVVKVVVYVTDMRDREGVWRARREVFNGDFPTSTLIGISQLADPRMKVEIEAVAHIGASARG